MDNSKVPEIMLDTDAMAWQPLSEGIGFKVLRVSPETGTWTVLLNCAKGSSFAPHYHHGAGEYYVIKGRMDYRMGTAKTADYGYEPLGAYHESTSFSEDTVLLFTNHGPVAFVGPDQSIVGILDWKFFADRAA